MIGLAEYEIPQGCFLSGGFLYMHHNSVLPCMEVDEFIKEQTTSDKEQALKSILGKAVLALNANTKPTQAQFDAMMEERKCPDGRTIWYWGAHPILMEMPDGTLQLP